MNFKKLGFLGCLFLTTSIALTACGGNNYTDYADGLTESQGLLIQYMDEIEDDMLKFATNGETKFRDMMGVDKFYVLAGPGTCNDARIVVPEFYDDGTHGKLPVAAIKDWCGLGNNGATTLVCHNTLKSIGQLGARGITRIVANGVVVLGDGSCSNGHSEWNVAPQGLQWADQWAFFFNTVSTKIWLPKTLTHIGPDILMGSTYTDVYFEGTQEEWNKIEFTSGSWADDQSSGGKTMHFEYAYPADKVTVQAYVAPAA